MAAVLSNEVKQALQDIYYNVRTGRGKEAFALLERASAAGDGDASCVLARCLCGYQYVWSGHGFPEDDSTNPWSRAAPWGCWWPCGAGS